MGCTSSSPDDGPPKPRQAFEDDYDNGNEEVRGPTYTEDDEEEVIDVRLLHRSSPSCVTDIWLIF